MVLVRICELQILEFKTQDGGGGRRGLHKHGDGLELPNRLTVHQGQPHPQQVLQRLRPHRGQVQLQMALGQEQPDRTGDFK